MRRCSLNNLGRKMVTFEKIRFLLDLLQTDKNMWKSPGGLWGMSLDSDNKIEKGLHGIDEGHLK